MAPPTIEDVRVRLLQRAQRQALRARRARIGSNERRKALANARFFTACVQEIDTDKKLHAHLTQTDALMGGWKALADAVVVYVRERERKKKALHDHA